MAMATPLRNGLSSFPPASSACAMIGFEIVKLHRHSIMNERPEPFAPPRGRRVAILLGSLVGRPSAPMPQSGGTCRPASRALSTLPMATVDVDMSTRKGGLPPAGNASAIGLVDTPATRVPW
jgi:hypothetical protein